MFAMLPKLFLLCLVLVSVLHQISGEDIENVIESFRPEFDDLKKLIRVGIRESNMEIDRAKQRIEETIDEGRRLKDDHLRNLVFRAENVESEKLAECLEIFHNSVRHLELHPLKHCQMSHEIATSKHSKSHMRHLLTKVDDKIVVACHDKFSSIEQKADLTKCVGDHLSNIKEKVAEEEDKITAVTKEAMLSNELCVSKKVKELTDDMDAILVEFEKCIEKK